MTLQIFTDFWILGYGVLCFAVLYTIIRYLQ